MACDVCGAVGTSLADLREIYQTDKIKQVCLDCEKITNKALRDIQSSHEKAQRSLLKRFLQVLKIEKSK